MSARDCRCNCNLVNKIVRAYGAISNLGLGVGAGFLVVTGAAEYLAPTASCTFVDNSRVGVFHGVIGVWYVLFALLGFLAELRFSKLRTTVLAPFGFMLTYLGRGVTYLTIGCIFCAIPIARGSEIITMLPGGNLMGVGLIEIILAIFVIKEKNVVVVRKVAVGPGASVRWGESETANATPPAADEEAGTPSRTKLVAEEKPAAAAAAVATKNPFRK